MSCATEDLKANLGFGVCDAPMARGVGESIFFGRFAWLATSSADSQKKKIIRTLTLNSGKKLIRLYSPNFSNQVTQALSASDNGNKVAQTIRTIINTDDPAEEEEIDKLINVKDGFLIYRKNGNSGKFKVLGWKTGLKMISLASDTNDETNKGAYVIELSAPDEAGVVYTLQHMTTDTVPVDDTVSYVEALAMTLS